MAALINALDNYTPIQLGEKGHVEYGWTSQWRELIVQLDFQLVKCENSVMNELDEKVHQLLTSLLKNGLVQEEKREYLSLLYRMIGSTRDILDGKGENTLAYMLIYRWYKDVNPELAYFALKCFVDLEKHDIHVHPYGSWKDIKYFCRYVLQKEGNKDHPLIHYGIRLMNEQLKRDASSNEQVLSLVSKWIPRENSQRFGWLFTKLAVHYYSEIFVTAKTTKQKERAEKKCKMLYRQLISSLNKRLDTVQIKQCGKMWASIDFNHVTSITFSKQKKAFLNETKGGEKRTNEEDRVLCATHFTEHIQKAVLGEKEVNGKRVGMDSFTKQALDLIQMYKEKGIEADLLNSQWRDNATQTHCLQKMIPMVDVSGSMEEEHSRPLHSAIALGIRIAEKSVVGKRVMTFSSNPEWVNLEDCDGFVSMVNRVRKSSWGVNTNFYAAQKKILNAILQAIQKKTMTFEDVKDMTLVILSDMQIDCALKQNNKSLFESIQTMYAEAGIIACGKPFQVPHIVFWNLRSTNGFPCLSKDENCSMMSGYSASLLNLFCEKGLASLENCTPWTFLEEKLNNDRYVPLKKKLEELL